MHSHIYLKQNTTNTSTYLIRNGCIVDEQIDPTFGVLDIFSKSFDAAFIRDIQLVEKRFQARFFQLFDSLLSSAHVPGGQINLPLELFAEALNDSETYALVGAGDLKQQRLLINCGGNVWNCSLTTATFEGDISVAADFEG